MAASSTSSSLRQCVRAWRSVISRTPPTTSVVSTSRSLLFRGLSSTATSTSASTSSDTNYASPLQDLFEKMHRNGPTTLGTETDPASGKAVLSNSQSSLKCGIPSTALRFTTSSYGRTMMAPYVHVREHQVILKVNLRRPGVRDDSSSPPCYLTDLEQAILLEIVGPSRYNVQTQELRLTSNSFGSRIENKRHLTSMLDRIIISCQRLAKEMIQDTNSNNQF